MPLDQLLERNRAFRHGREARPLNPAGTINLAIVGCYDPRLDTLLLPALGLQPGEAFLLRTAGALVQPGGGVMRSLALGVFMFGVREVVVVGHTSCRMAMFDTASFIELFRKRGVSREAFGAMDLREWAGAIPDPKRGVEISIANIAGAAFLPRDVTVSGLLLNDSTGELTVVPAGREQAPRAAAEMSTASSPTRPMARDAERAPNAPSSRHLSAAAALGSFLKVIESEGHWPQDVQRLRHELASQTNPLAQLQSLKAFARKASKESAEVARAYDVLKQALQLEPDTGDHA